jgi:hypothetical protein
MNNHTTYQRMQAKFQGLLFTEYAAPNLQLEWDGTDIFIVSDGLRLTWPCTRVDRQTTAVHYLVCLYHKAKERTEERNRKEADVAEQLEQFLLAAG